MFKIIIIFVLLYLVYLKIHLKLSIDLKSLYRKGFKKIDNQFRPFLLLWETTAKAKLIQA